jgi:hypothetical protein
MRSLMNVFRLAGAAAGIAVLTLVISGIALALFFGGAGAVWGPINDLFVAITVLLLIPAMVALMRLAPAEVGAWFTLISFLAIAGAVAVATVQLLLVVGVIDLQASFLFGGISILPVIAWGVAMAYLGLAHGVPTSLGGWLILGVLVTAGLLTVVSFTLGGMATVVLGVGVVGLLSAWLATLARDLLAYAS